MMTKNRGYVLKYIPAFPDLDQENYDTTLPWSTFNLADGIPTSKRGALPRNGTRMMTMTMNGRRMMTIKMTMTM
jgi:hypothetical protein